MTDGSLPRVSPPRIFPEATRASRPPAGSAGSPDTHRQTGFVLGDEVDHIVAALDLEGRAAQASSGAKYRKQVVAASLVSWSRSWLLRLQALHAVEWGNYTAAFPLISAAVEAESASAAILSDGGAAWEAWLTAGGIAHAPEDHATRLRPGSSPAPTPPGALDTARQVAGLLASSDFAAAVLLAANESGPDRVLVTFGDRDFHLGLAEIALGLLVDTCAARATLLLAHQQTLGTPDPPAFESSLDAAARILRRSDRCRADLRPNGIVIENWRRIQAGQPRRLIL